jgi:tetratricopeptide (TPR) repeat protein
VVEPGAEGYGYRDLVAAREVARLLGAGVDLAAVIESAVQLRRRGVSLSEIRLAGTPGGEVLRDVDGQLIGLDGQLRLPILDEVDETPDGVIAAAEDAEDSGDLDEAERLYRRAVMMDRSDPVAPFHLGNVLDAQGRAGEAALAWRVALQRDAGFAEAWFNLALGAEAHGRPDEAVFDYRCALAASPDYADAAYNLGLVLADRGCHGEALPLFEHFLKLEPRAKEAPLARRLAAECRLTLRAAAIGAPAPRPERPAPRRR